MMADDNLFLALKKYTPGPNIDPRENFLTEAFAWLLRQHEGLASDFLQLVLEQRELDFSLDPEARPQWLTQSGNAKARLDMVADFGTQAIIFEHKLWTPLGEDQIKKYREYGATRWIGAILVVLITSRRAQFAQNPDVALTWGDVYQCVSAWLEDQTDKPSLVRHFLGLLQSEGLSPPAPISHEAILSYLPAKTVEPRLERLIQEVAQRDWGWFYDRMAWPAQERKPLVRGLKWGRMGVDLLDDFRPGIFVGAMLDGDEHRVGLSDRALGPDFSLVLTYHTEEGAPSREEFLDSDEFVKLKRRLAAGACGWDFVDHFLNNLDPNPWHPLHLRKPLLEVMRGTQTFEDQVLAFLKAGREVIEVLLSGGELEAFKARWASP
jgi:hypothetical protein